MRNPKHSDKEMISLRDAQRNLHKRQTELQRAADEALRSLVLACEDAVAAVQAACDVPPMLVLDDTRCRWLSRDESGRLTPVDTDEDAVEG